MTTKLLDRIVSYVTGTPPEPWMPDATDEEIMKILYSHTGDFISYGSIAVPLKENGILSDWEEGYVKYYSNELFERLDRLWWYLYVDKTVIGGFKREYRLSDLGIGHIRKMERENGL